MKVQPHCLRHKITNYSTERVREEGSPEKSTIYSQFFRRKDLQMLLKCFVSCALLAQEKHQYYDKLLSQDMWTFVAGRKGKC
jgi:hypothetical protein